MHTTASIRTIKEATGCTTWEAKEYLTAARNNEDTAIKNYRADAGLICPACSSKDTESNGHTEYRCRTCDDRWGWDNGTRYNF